MQSSEKILIYLFRNAAARSFLRFLDDVPDILFRFHARRHDLMAAFLAFQFKIDAGAQDDKAVPAARVIFFHLHNVADRDIRSNRRPFRLCR
jgi:hypothetical protein